MKSVLISEKDENLDEVSRELYLISASYYKKLFDSMNTLQNNKLIEDIKSFLDHNRSSREIFFKKYYLENLEEEYKFIFEQINIILNIFKFGYNSKYESTFPKNSNFNNSLERNLYFVGYINSVKSDSLKCNDQFINFCLQAICDIEVITKLIIES